MGADPGGKRAFGVAVLRDGEPAQTWIASCADEAVDWLVDTGVTSISAVGVDAPLWWSSARAGGRHADRWIRDTHRIAGGTVQSANSLQGAALVQGAMFVDVVRRRCGVGGVTESHPKALLRALDLAGYDEAFARFGVTCANATEHECDAVLSAVAAREGFSGRWSTDLSEKRDRSEQDPQTYWLGPVRYFWPTVVPALKAKGD
ncbi:MAG: hypothetical protein R3B68_01840 [Phycisphaerales bacterium]